MSSQAPHLLALHQLDHVGLDPVPQRVALPVNVGGQNVLVPEGVKVPLKRWQALVPLVVAKRLAAACGAQGRGVGCRKDKHTQLDYSAGK